MGHSLGAGVAALLAGTWPERVRRLVLLEGLGPDDRRRGARSRAPARGDGGRARRGAPRRPRTGYADAEQVARGWRRRCRCRVVGPHAARPRAGREENRSLGLARRRQQPASAVAAAHDRGQVEAFLRAITCPTLLVRAEPGMPATEAYFAGRAALIADLTWSRLPGGHHVHLDDPAAVAAVVGPFLA
jgi:pimeloyl-ACP methyl ester carboxylesterase